LLIFLTDAELLRHQMRLSGHDDLLMTGQCVVDGYGD
jgi:hypothetical protein